MVHDLVEISVGNIAATDDSDGHRTSELLKRTRKVAELICSNKPGSIGLHPAVYFYSWTGKQQPVLFLTMAEMMVEMERNKTLRGFVAKRKSLEDFIMQNRSLFNQIVRKFGTKESGKGHLKSFYSQVLDFIGEGCSQEELVSRIVSHTSGHHA